MAAGSVFLFSGPTAHGLPRELFASPELHLCPPAVRGSISAIVEQTRPKGCIILVDGRFGDVMAVGHREILDALDRGWEVWGLASIGAIRAAELSSYGMIGFGEVFRHFSDTAAPDDEVAVLHGPEPDYKPLTEALIDIRCFLRHLVRVGVLTDENAYDVAEQLSSRWFGDRTLPVIIETCREVAGSHAAESAIYRAGEIPAHRLKSLDLHRFLQSREWAQS